MTSQTARMEVMRIFVPLQQQLVHLVVFTAESTMNQVITQSE